MRPRSALLALLLLLIPALAAAAIPRAPRRAIPVADARPAYAPHDVLVALRPADAAALLAPGAAARAPGDPLAAALARHGLARAAALAPVRAGARAAYLRLSSDRADFDPRAAARDLVASGRVIAACPDLHLRPDFTPNDPYLPDQWHLGTSTAAIRIRNAWDIQRGSPSVVIGIMDTGVDAGHPDLSARIAQNTGEIPGNGVDDDGNGYVDDVAGWDFGDHDADPSPEPVYDPDTGIDVGWHGTFVAGLAAATTNEGVGIAGVAGGCSILPLKVSDAAGDIPLSAVTEAFAYAIARHVSVLNMSFGTSDTTALAYFQSLTTDAFDGGIACVAGAGNDGTDAMTFPAACDSVLSVASTNASNQRSSFSQWGEWVDVAAPGEGMWSSIARNYVYDDVSELFFEVLWGYDGVNPYMSGDGTSFSSPVAAGVVALVRSQFPALGPLQALQQVIVNGDVVATYDNPIGPRVNAYRALTTPLAVGPATGVPTARLEAQPNPAAGAMRISFVMPVAGEARLEVLDTQGRLVRELVRGELGPGAQQAVWDGADAAGRVVPAGVYFARLEAPGERRLRTIVRLR